MQNTISFQNVKLLVVVIRENQTPNKSSFQKNISFTCIFISISMCRQSIKILFNIQLYIANSDFCFKIFRYCSLFEKTFLRALRDETTRTGFDHSTIYSIYDQMKNICLLEGMFHLLFLQFISEGIINSGKFKVVLSSLVCDTSFSEGILLE